MRALFFFNRPAANCTKNMQNSSVSHSVCMESLELALLALHSRNRREDGVTAVISLAGATAADAVTAGATAAGDYELLGTALGAAMGKRPRAVNPATLAASTIAPSLTQLLGDGGIAGPAATSFPTKAVCLGTPDLTKTRALGKSKAMDMRTGEKKEFNLARDEVVDRLTHAVGFNGVSDTCCVTPKLKGVPDPSQCTQGELTRSL
jgi:hypothetical protein